MFKFSIVIPAFNKQDYIADCLCSLLNQTYDNWEAIVVDDGSKDNTVEIIQEFVSGDKRFKLICHSENKGTHCARLSGVVEASGEYLLFLDADDSLKEYSLSFLASVLSKSNSVDPDILHYGIDVISMGGNEDFCNSFQTYINKDFENLYGGDILSYAFAESEGYLQDWRVTQRLYKTVLIKDAFSKMVNQHLIYAEDAYEYFVISSLAKCQITCNCPPLLSYFFGRGLNGSDKISASKLIQEAQYFQKNIELIEEFSKTYNINSSFYFGACKKLYELLMNDWLYRLDVKEQLEVLDKLGTVIGREILICNLARLVRDGVYDQLVNPTSSYSFELLEGLLLYIQENSANIKSAEFLELQHKYSIHLRELGRKMLMSKGDNQKIKIFVSTHKDIDLFDSSILQPVQVGCANTDNRFYEMLRDNEGENISNLNPMFCELTTQYWAWKNVKSDYIGFCHYRRYFDFSGQRHKENEYGEIIDSSINARSQAEYCLWDEAIESLVSQYDIVTTENKKLADFPGDIRTPWEQYVKAPLLFESDLKRVVDILKQKYPDYSQDADAYLNGHKSRFCNMFIMKAPLFADYSEWLFDILFEFMKDWDFSNYSKEALRTPGHLSERLLNIYLIHLQRLNPMIKIKELQCVHFAKPERTVSLLPLESHTQKVIPVVFAADDNYVPMVTTSLLSMIQNASKDFYYDVTILENRISNQHKETMASFFSSFNNLNIRFINASSIVDKYGLQTNNAHIGVETYYRFLIQDLLYFYDKVLYLDSDIIVKGDISELYNTELGTSLVAAVRDLDFLGNLNIKDGLRMDYARNVLHLGNPYNYFQAGVLLFNTKEMRSFHTVDEWLNLAANKELIYNDQDVLNSECQGRVKFIDYSWNVMNDCADRIAKVFSIAPAHIFEAYLKSRNCQRIIHYAGFEKPWNTIPCDQGCIYWEYARKTPFYEELIAKKHTAPVPHVIPKAISESNPIRRFVDPFFPIGSRRREFLKRIVRAIRGIK